MSSLSQGLQNLRRQWQGSAILRLGAMAAVAIIWLNVLWAHSDNLAERREQARFQHAELERMEKLRTGPRWDARVDEARFQLERLELKAWTESTKGLAQAAFQDFLTQSMATSGLLVKEVRLGTGPDIGTSSGTGPDSAGMPSFPVGDWSEVRARVVAEYRPKPLASWLNELSSNPQQIVVDRFQLRQWLQPPQVELDVRIVVRHLGTDK